MKTNTLAVVLSWLSLAVLPASAQSAASKTNATQAEAMELLRRTIAEQQANPNKVIRTFTNAPAGTNRPTRALPSTSTTFAELERQYLDGKITAKQFQKRLEEENKRAAAEADKARVLEALRQQQAAKQPAPKTPAAGIAPAPGNSPAAPRSSATPAPASPTEPNPQQKKLSEVEARIDEMIRQKAARDKAALTNASSGTNNIPSGPQTKRQRLDALLKQYVDGTISDAVYNEKRGKILAEP